ncbi:MAG: DegV family protein [Agathobacter sp.]|nr:DegV family protein [Agathobacter sp.]
MLRILVDTSADYTVEELKERNLELVSLNIIVDNKSYRDVVDITREEVYDILINQGKFPKTSQPSPQDFLEIFEDVKEKGDSMVVITLSSALSGTYQSAVLAKNMVEYDSIYIIDSLSATYGIRHLGEYACALRNDGMDASTIAERLEALKSRIVILAAVDTLEYLCKGGRVSKTTAAVGELANIKPLITVTEEGKVHVPGKCLGRNKALATLVKNIGAYEIDESFPVYSIYAYGEENTMKLEEKLSATGIHCAERLQIGATIGVHVGPGAYGAIFIRK